MNTSDELERLSKLHKDGALSDDEFAQAKRKLLNQSEPASPSLPPAPAPQRVEEVGSRDFAFQTVMIVLVVVLLVIFLVALVPHWHHMHWGH